MLFKIVSFHPSSDGSVKPSEPTLVQSATHFIAKRVAGAHLAVPSDDIKLELHEGPIPLGFVVVDEHEFQRVA